MARRQANDSCCILNLYDISPHILCEYCFAFIPVCGGVFEMESVGGVWIRSVLFCLFCL